MHLGNSAICSTLVTEKRFCSFVSVSNTDPWPGYSLWVDFDFGGQVTPYATTTQVAAYLVSRLEFKYTANQQIYEPSGPQWQSSPDRRQITMTDTGFILYDPLLALGNWSITIKSTANDASASTLRFLKDGQSVNPLFSCNITIPVQSQLRLLAAVDGLLSFSAPVRKCSGSALTASDFTGWNCTGTLTLISTGESVPTGFSRLWRCATLVNDSSLVSPVASAVCDQYGSSVSLLFRGLPVASSTSPFTDVNSDAGLFDTFWFVDPSTRNISRVLTRARAIFNDSAMQLIQTIDTFGCPFDQWMAFSSPSGFVKVNDTSVYLYTGPATATTVATTSSGATNQSVTQLYTANQFPMSHLYNCSKVDLWNSSFTTSAIWGFQCTVAGYETPPLFYVSKLTCVDASSSATVPIANVSFPAVYQQQPRRINVAFGSGTMFDDVVCFSSTPTQVTIEDTTQALPLNSDPVYISSVYLTSSISLAYPDSLVVRLSETNAIVPMTVLQQAVDQQLILLYCDQRLASVVRPDSTSAGQFVLQVQNCTSTHSTYRPPDTAALEWPASIVYADGRVVSSSFSDSDVSTTMNERVVNVVCVDGAIFVLFDRPVNVSAQDNRLSSTCTSGGLSMRGSLGRTVILDILHPEPCSFSFDLQSGSHVYLNGDW